MLFEESMDIGLTLKCIIGLQTSKAQLIKVFENYNVTQSSLTCKFHPYSSLLQYIYIKFDNVFHMQRAYENRKLLKSKGYNLRKLYPNMIAQSLPSKEKSMYVVFPPQEVYKCSLPSRNTRTDALKKLFEMMLETSTLNIEMRDIGDIYYITFETTEQMCKAFNSQPYFGSAVAQKAFHISPLLNIKNNKKQCLMCSAPRSEKCFIDLCDDCCRVQINPRCTHNLCYNDGNENCKMCKTKSNNICTSKLCKNCCDCQVINPGCDIHRKIMFLNGLSNISTVEALANYIDLDRAKTLLSLFSMAKEGLLLPGVNEKTIASFESFGINHKKNLEDGTIVHTGNNAKGKPYIDYIYDPSCASICKDAQFETSEKKEEKESESKVKPSFHIMVANISLLIPQEKLISIIYDELNKKGCKVSSNSIKLIDAQSVLNLALNNECDCKAAINQCGSICCIYFNDISHSLPILVKEVELNIPRQNEEEELIVIPSQTLIHYIENYN